MPYTGPFVIRAGPIVDGRYVQGGIAEGFAAGKQAKVPLLIGGNSNEASLFRPQPAAARRHSGRSARPPPWPPSIPTARATSCRSSTTWRRASTSPSPTGNISRLQSKAGQPVYLYYFSYVTPARNARRRCGAVHTAEIPFAFAGPKQKFAAEDQPLATSVNAYWAAFIKTGNPGAAGGPAWPKFARLPRPPWSSAPTARVCANTTSPSSSTGPRKA